MNAFGKQSLENLQRVHPFLIETANRVLQVVDHSIICGSRTPLQQDQLFQSGKTKLMGDDPRALHVLNEHRTESWAIDVAPWYVNEPHIRYPDHFVVDIIDIKRPLFLRLEALDEYTARSLAFGRLAECYMREGEKVASENPEWHGLRLGWGGDWDHDYDLSDNRFDDLPHIFIYEQVQ